MHFELDIIIITPLSAKYKIVRFTKYHIIAVVYNNIQHNIIYSNLNWRDNRSYNRTYQYKIVPSFILKRRYTSTETHHDESRTSSEQFHPTRCYTRNNAFPVTVYEKHYRIGFGNRSELYCGTGYCRAYVGRFRCPIYIYIYVYIPRSRYNILFNIGTTRVDVKKKIIIITTIITMEMTIIIIVIIRATAPVRVFSLICFEFINYRVMYAQRSGAGS